MTAGRLALAAALAFAPPAAAQVAPLPVGAAVAAPIPAIAVPYYSMNLAIRPEAHALQAQVRMRLIPQRSGLSAFNLRLHPGLKVSRVTVNDRPARHARAGESLAVSLPAYKVGQKLVLQVDYQGRPLEAIGDRKLQDLGPEAAVLHPKGRWYPQPAESQPAAASIHLKLPTGWKVAGPADRATADKALHHLEFAKPGPLALVAGPFQVYHAAGLTTYTRPKGTVVEELKAGSALLGFYRVHGLGFGRTSGTLIELPAAYRALVLPGWQARPMSPGGLADWVALAQWTAPNAGSASHIERQWLGHSLVAFTEDMRTEAKEGRLAYQRALMGHLEAYQEFLRTSPESDVPLGQPIDPEAIAWDPVVRHKGALIWAMLRDELGDAALWKALRLYQANLASRRANVSLFHEALGRRTDFLYGWLANTGLPAMRLRGVKVAPSEDGWQVSGRLVQEGPFFRLPLELALIGEGEVQRVSFQSFAPETPFHFVTKSRPMRVVLDPEERRPIARRQDLLIPEGIAPTGGVIVYGTRGTDEETAANLEAARAMQARLRKYKDLFLPIRADGELTDEERGRSLLVFGRPGTNSVAAALENQLPVRFISGKAVWWQGRTYQRPRNGTVQIIANPHAPDETVVLFAAMSPEGMPDTLGFTQLRATFCVFEEGDVLEQGRFMRPFPDLEAVLY